MKRFAARHEKARSELKRAMAQATTESIIAERKHWVESGRAISGNSARQ